MADIQLYRKIVFLSNDMPVEIRETTLQTSGFDFLCHWHKHLQMYQILAGSAVIYCNYAPIQVAAGDVALINIDELHYLESLSNDLKYRIVKIDFACLLGSSMDECRVKFLEPLLQQRLLFDNRIAQDVDLCQCLDKLAYEYSMKLPAYELACRSCLFDLLAILVRSHTRKASGGRDMARAVQQNRQFQEIIAYIEENLAEKIPLEKLAAMAHMSPEHFCRTFKRLTGRTAVDYINRLRVEKAHGLLTGGGCNVTEAALATGFTDTNYFSRIYRKYKLVAPSEAK